MPTDTVVPIPPPSPADRTPRLSSLLCLLLIVGAARVAVVIRTDTIARDGTVFLHMAREITGGAEVDDPLRAFRQHPGYPLLVAGLARATGASWPDGWALAGQAVSVMIGLAALAAVYLIGTDLAGRKVALVGALVFGLAPRFSDIACDVTAEATALALGMWAVAAALWARRAIADGKWRGALLGAAAGVLGGLAYLTRPEFLLTPALAVLAMLAIRSLSGRSRRIQLASIGATIVLTIACILPYAIAIGSLTLKKSISDLTWVAGPVPLAAVAATGTDPAPPMRVGEQLSQALGPSGTIAAGVAIITWVGLLVLRLRPPREAWIVPTGHGMLLMFAPLAAIVPLMTALEANWGPGYVSARHMLICAAMLAPAAGAGVLIISVWAQWLLQYGGAGRWAPTVALVAILATAIGLMLPRTLNRLHEGKAPHRYAGVLLAKIGGGGQFVAGPNSWVPFYALVPAEQFTEGTDMSPTLTADDVRSPDALVRRLRRTDPNRQYRFLAMGRKLRRAVAETGTLDNLPADRMVLVKLASVGEGRNQVDLYEVRRPPAQTRAPPGDQ